MRLALLLFSSSLVPKPRSPSKTLLLLPFSSAAAAAAAGAAEGMDSSASASASASASSVSLREALAEKQAAVDAQGDAVRALKARAGAGRAEIDAAVDALKALKLEAAALSRQIQSSAAAAVAGREALRQAVVNTLERRLFYIPSFKIYRGVAGLFDYGPPAAPSSPTSSPSGAR
uniref:WHEP-TRS domain-containing protein n=1 Tax=Ananas comosus var. bracteatus TaxID=296719 RepID=A0A6V7P0F1_ANACO|nr:unnamed protein product [Ananas comosus var. bracteatus]